MPTFIANIPELDESVTRPVLHQVLVAFQKHLRLDNNIIIKLLDDGEVPPLQGSNISDADVTPQTKDLKYLIATYKDEAFDKTIFQTMYKRRTNESIFRDDICNLDIYPVISSRKITVTLEYLAPSKIAALQFVNYLNARLSESLNSFITNIYYQVPVPNCIDTLIKYTFRLRNKVNKPIPLKLYTEKTFRIKHSILTNQLGTHPQLAFNYQYNDVRCYFSPDDLPELTRDKDGTYSVPFKFDFYYDRPINFNVKYPIYLYNEEVASRYINHKINKNEIPLLPVGKNQNIIESTSWLYNERRKLDPETGFVFPHYDDWVRPRLSGEIALFQLALFVDLDDKSLILNLDDLKSLGINLDSELIRYIKEQRTRVFNSSKSPFYFKLYAGKTHVTTDLFITDTGDIRAKWDLNPNKFYHLTLLTTRNLYWLDDETKKIISNYPVLLDKLEATINSGTGHGSNGNGHTLVPDYENEHVKPVTRPELHDWINDNSLSNEPHVPTFEFKYVNPIVIYTTEDEVVN